MREEKCMFCRMCGHKLTDGARFCPSCGAKVTVNVPDAARDAQKESQPGAGYSDTDTDNIGTDSADETDDAYGYGFADANAVSGTVGTARTGSNTANGAFDGVGGNSEKIGWKEVFTAENIERFAPAAALFAIGRGVVGIIVGIVLGILVLLLPFTIGIVKVVAEIISIVFIVATGAAAGGLIYVAVKKKDPSRPGTWVAPIAALLSFLSCVGTGTSWYGLADILGIVAAILGIELFARIVISGQPMDTKVDYKTAFALYKKILSGGKKKNAETAPVEPYMCMEPSEFTGTGLECFGIILLSFVVGVITCGIATPWMMCKAYRWRIGHTKINGKKLTFTGTGASLLGHWILWALLTIVTCGFFAFFAYVALRKWELEHTFIDGEPVSPNEKVSYFDGGSFAYFGYGLLASLIIILTLGLAYPWVMVMLQKWDTKHQVINGRRLMFNGTGLGFLGEYLIIFLLTFITCGIYGSWGIARLNRYIIRHTNFAE